MCCLNPIVFMFYKNAEVFLKEQLSSKPVCRIWKCLTLASLSDSVKTEAAADSNAQDVYDYWGTSSSYCVLIIGSPTMVSKSI